MDMHVLSYSDVRAAVSMSEAIDAVRAGFVGLARGDFEVPARTHLRDGQFLVMMAHHRPTRSAIVKTLSLNFESRDPSILGTVTWAGLDDTNQIIADAAAVTALRTGAVSGVATDLLAVRDASTATVIGAGAQGRDQARAIHTVRPRKELTIVNTSISRADALASTLSDEFGGAVEISTGTDAEEAVEGRDIVCCATTSRTSLFRSQALAPHAHVNAIGSFRPDMHELPGDLLANSYVVVDAREAVLQESGEIIDAVAAGVIDTQQLHELGFALQSPPQRSGRTVFKSVGLAIQDWAIANAMAQQHL